jgi:hypothetical protein
MVAPLWFIQIFLLPETLRSLVGNGSIYANPTPLQAWNKYQENKKKVDLQEKSTITTKPNNKADFLQPDFSFYPSKTAYYSDICSEDKTVCTKNSGVGLNTTKDSGSNSHVLNTNYFKRFLHLPNLFQSLTYLKEKDIAVLLLYNSLQYAGLYSVLTSLTELFTSIYGLNEFQVGLCFLSNGFGASIGSFTAGRLLNWKFKKIAESLNIDEKYTKRYILSINNINNIYKFY